MDEEKVEGAFLSAAEAMQLALNEARKGFAHVSPNPLVGCVILDSQGRFLAKGHHEKYGGLHAEANALALVPEDRRKDAQVFVTLEPCAHEGRTPSCAKLLAKWPLRRVVFGIQDPNPLVSGQGVDLIRQAGIECVPYREIFNDHLAQELEEVCEAFLWNFRHQSVFVSLKIACSLDSQIAMASGESQWITGEEARQEVHRLRAAHDAVMVGSGTVIADNPRLDVRHPQIMKSNTVIVLDPTARLRGRHSEFKLAERGEGRRLIWLEGLRDPNEILKRLWNEGLRSVMIEGGSQVASAFLQEGLINRLHLFRAPSILGAQGRSFTEFLRLSDMDLRFRLRNVQSLNLGPDSYLSGLLRDPQTGLVYRGM